MCVLWHTSSPSHPGLLFLGMPSSALRIGNSYVCFQVHFRSVLPQSLPCPPCNKELQCLASGTHQQDFGKWQRKRSENPCLLIKVVSGWLIPRGKITPSVRVTAQHSLSLSRMQYCCCCFWDRNGNHSAAARSWVPIPSRAVPIYCPNLCNTLFI